MTHVHKKLLHLLNQAKKKKKKYVRVKQKRKKTKHDRTNSIIQGKRT